MLRLALSIKYQHEQFVSLLITLFPNKLGCLVVEVGRGVFPVNVGKKMYVTQIQFLRSFCYLKCPVLFGYITVRFFKPLRKAFEREWRRRYSDARLSSSYL